MRSGRRGGHCGRARRNGDTAGAFTPAKPCWWRAGGVLVVMVDLTMLQPVLDAADSGRNGFVTLFLADGWLLATTPRNEALFERH